MANTASAKKAVRSSANKVSVNEGVRERYTSARKGITRAAKAISAGTLKLKAAKLDEKLRLAYKEIDKAAKSSVNVISKNKANRLKAKMAKQVAALTNKS